MATLRCQILCLFVFGIANAQFPNPFSVMMNSGTGNSKNATGCASQTVSCAPWCSRSVDSSGCVICQCKTGGVSMMGGMNPMSGGMNPMGMNPMGQLAQMFPGLTGGLSPMTGSVQKQDQSCPPAPTTCPYPQPWCARVADKNGCVNCLCGKDLATLQQQNKNEQTIPTTTLRPIVTDTTTNAPTTTFTSGTTTHAPTTKSAQSCLDTFYCTKLCDYGYKTDDMNCPLCECMSANLIDTPVDATNPPGKFMGVLSTTNAVSMTTDDVTSCPGIFDCAVICNNGYKTDSKGCPLCACDNQ